MLQEDRLFSLQELNNAVQQHVFDVLTPSKLGMQRRRKICIVPAENLLRFHKDNDEIEARVPFQSINVVCKNAASDKLLTIETNAASEVLKFRSFVEREAFCRFLQAISPMISVVTDAEIVEDGKIVYHIETANMMGLASGGTLVLDPAKRTIEFAGQQIPVDSLQLDCPSGIPRRVDLTYVNLDRTLSLKLGRSKKKLSCNFPSLYHRERFCGRVRACQLGYRGNEEEIHMPTGETIKVYTATWNCGDKKPPASFEPWISAGTHDIYAIGLQECGPKQKWFKKLTAFLCSDEAAKLAEARYREMISSSARDPHSMTKLTSSFEDMQGMGYKLLSITSLWDIHLVVVVRSDLRNRLSMLSSGTEATGIAHVLGNKGGAACGFTLDNSTAFTFVTSHLAARATRIPQRQENIESIIKGLHFEAVAPLKGMPVTHHSDYVFWLGDLNYRVDMGQHGSEEEFKVAVEYALTKQVDNLVAHCQLKREMGKNAVFVGFEEGPITFAPTYRLIKGKDEYSNKKNQNPSYCDRVLFKTAPGVREKIRQTHYTGVFELNQSDHRPVAAAFDVTLKAPFILRNSINDNSAVDCCVVNFSNLNFTVAPEVCHPVCRTVRYDGYTGPMAISFHSIALRSVEKTLPSACENPSVAPAAAKAAALQKKKKKDKKGKKGKGEKGVEESKDEGVEDADEADESEADVTDATTDPDEEDHNSEVEETKASITTPELELPQWSWTDSQTPIIVPSVSDCEWLAEQLVVATVHRYTADGQAVGSCEIPLNLAINSRDRGSTNFKSADASTLDGRGVPFSRDVVMNGKWVGTLTGKLHVRYYGGSPNNGDEFELLEEMNDWHRLLTLSRKSAMPTVAVTDQAPEAAAVYDGGIAKRMETISATTVQGTMAAVVTDDELDFEPMERPMLPFLMTLKDRTRHRRAALDLDLGSIAEGARSENERESDVSRDSDLEDMEGADGVNSVRASTMLEADVDDDAAAEEDAREVWMEDGYVVSKTGKRWAKHEFVCTATGKPLIDDEFLMMDGLPYCRKAYMDLFGKGLCAGCLQVLERGADVIAAVGYKFHAACFVCAHTGRNLPIYEPYFEHDGLPYCAEAYLELFHSCPKCLETVPFTAEDGDPNKGVRAIGKVWHTRCLNCASCGCNFDGACFAYDMEDGRGSQPYCENCYRDSFMPTCAGCNEHIMLGSEEAVHACGQLWHREHFRCAASGQPILDEYYENNGLPYCAAKYFELFGQRCAHCGEVVTEEIIEAMGQAWHPEHFVCVSSGKLLSKDEHGSFQYYEKDLKPYCREEYARLFCQDCARCGERVIDDKIMFHQHHFHPDCFTCEQCSCDLRERPRYAAPTTNRPYCDACFTQNFGKICAACSFVIDVNDQQVEVGDKHWHAEHFVCGNCNKSLIGIGFAEHDGIPFCIPCYEEAWASRCDTCGKPLSIEEDHIFIHESGKQYHRECYRCFICDQVFDDNAAIFIQNGHPFCQDDFADLFCENFCASCEKGIFGQRVVLIDKDWHPECIHCFECKRDLTSQPVFARFELGREHDKYISCQDHMIAAFAQLSAHGKDVVNGQFHAKAVATRKAKSNIYSDRLAEADRLSTERASLMLDNSNKARNRARSLMQTFMEDMRRTSGRFSVSLEDINRAGALAGLGQPLQSISEAQGSVKGSRPGSAATDDQPNGADEALESPQPGDMLDGRPPTPPPERPPTPPLPPSDEPPPPPEDEPEMPPPVMEEPPPPSPDTQETKQPDITSAIVKPVDIPSLAALTVPSHFTFDNDISGSVEKRGWLYKKGGGTSFMGRRNWTQRYFSLTNGVLSYYKSDKEYKAGVAPIKNCTFNLSQCRVELEEAKNKGDLRGFAIIPLNPQGGHKTLHLRAENEDVRHQWVVALSFGSTKKTTA